MFDPVHDDTVHPLKGRDSRIFNDATTHSILSKYLGYYKVLEYSAHEDEDEHEHEFQGTKS